MFKRSKSRKQIKELNEQIDLYSKKLELAQIKKELKHLNDKESEMGFVYKEEK